MFKKMIGIEYNWLMSMIDYLQTDIPKHLAEYGLGNISITVLSAYPKDMTKFVKPSIIVQKISTISDNVGYGGVLGQYDDDDNGIFDVFGKVYEMIAQIDVVGINRTQSTLLSSIIDERSLNMINDDDDDKYIPLNDYITDINNPIEVGRIDLYGNNGVMEMSLGSVDKDISGNDDYRTVIRFQCRVIQPIINMNQDMVDLSKSLKWRPRIKN